jgi:hypothetical protein
MSGQPQTLTDTSEHIVLVKRAPQPPTTCRFCYHRDCERRRREARVPCEVCDGQILPGERYRILSRINGEVVTAVHEGCERVSV